MPLILIIIRMIMVRMIQAVEIMLIMIMLTIVLLKIVMIINKVMIVTLKGNVNIYDNDHNS